MQPTIHVMASDTTDDITLQDDFIFDTGTADLVQVFINLHQISSAGSLPKLVLESCNDPSRGEWQEEWDSTGRAQASLDYSYVATLYAPQGINGVGGRGRYLRWRVTNLTAAEAHVVFDLMVAFS